MKNTKSKQIKIGMILNYAQLFLGIIISLCIHQTIINKIGMSENGILNLATNSISYLNLLSLGLGSAFIRFNIKYHVDKDIENERKLNGLFLIFYCLIIILMIVFGIIIIFFSGNIFREFNSAELLSLKKTMFIFLMQNCIDLFCSLYTMNINARERFVFAKTISIIKTIVLPVMKLIIVLQGFKSSGIAFVSLLVSIITGIIEGYYAIFVLKVRFKFGKFDKTLIKSIFSFSFFVFVNQIIDIINWQIDSLILGITSGTAAVAIYSIASTLNSYLLNFSSAISSVLIPRVNILVSKGASRSEINNLFIKIGRLQFLVIGMVLLGYIFFGKSFIINFYANNEYEESYYIGLLIMLPLLIPLIQNVGIELQRAYNKHKFRSVIYLIMAMINLLTSIPLGITFGGIGCAIGTCISLIVGNGIIMNIYYNKGLKIDIPLFWKEILKFLPALMLPVCLGIVFVYTIDLSNLIYFILCIVCFVFVYAISFLLFGLSKHERSFLLSKIKRNK